MGFKETSDAIREHDAHWIPKLILRGLLTVINLAIVGLAAWEISAIVRDDSYATDDLIENGAPWFFIPVGLSLIWTLVSVPILLARRKPAHPGFYVSFDLILFLIYAILGGLFVAVGVSQIQYVDEVSQNGGSNSQYGDFYFTYNYRNAGQGYPSSRYAVEDGVSYTYHSDQGTTVLRTPISPDYRCPYFDTCANQNDFFHTLRVRAQVTLAAAVLLLIGLLFHLALFIWACIDCARYNQQRAEEREYSRAAMMANRIVANMQYGGHAAPMQEKGMPQFAPAPAASGEAPTPALQLPPVHLAPGSGPSNYDFYAADRGAAYQPPTALPSSLAVAGSSKGKEPADPSV